MQLSGGPYSYNRFDSYEQSLEEGSGASDPHKMKAKVDAAASKKQQESNKLKKADKAQETKQEEDTMDEGFKPLPKEKMARQANKAFGQEQRAVRAGDEAGTNKQMQRRIAMKDPASRKNQLMNKEEVESFFIEDEAGNVYEGKKDACYHKVKSRYDVWPSAYASGALVKCRSKGAKNWGNSSKKESFVDEFGHEYLLELNNEETTETVMENRMAMYSRALGVMGAHYSGKPIEEKKADKDYDGDGKVESSKEEYFGSKDKAIKKAMAKEEVTVEEGYKSLPVDKMKKQQKGKSKDGDGPSQARTMEVVRKATQGSENLVKDAVKGQEMSNRKKGLEKKFNAPSANKSSKNTAYKLENQRRKDLDNRYGDKKEEVSITKEMVVEYLVTEGYASNEVSAEILHTHVSDEFLAQIEEQMLD